MTQFVLNKRLYYLISLCLCIVIGLAITSPQTVSQAKVDPPSSSSSQFNRSNKPLSEATIDQVFVDKSEQKLHLMEAGEIIKSYHIAMGDSPQGHKVQEGDEHTPEGTYVLDYKNENSIAYRSIHVSYPNDEDIAHAESLGVSAGGNIMIHGQMNGYESLHAINQQRNWTDGCMAVTNEEMDEIMGAIKVGTPINIVW